MKYLIIFSMIGLSVWMIYTSGRLVYLNAIADYKLPMDDIISANKAHGGSGAWRANRMTEEKWKLYNITSYGEYPDRPLAPSEQAEMERQIQSSNANADLRDYVASISLFQYPVLLITLILSIGFIIINKKILSFRIFGYIALLINTACLVTTVYLGPVRALMD